MLRKSCIAGLFVLILWLNGECSYSKAPFKVLYNDDLTNIGRLPAPWVEKLHSSFTDEMLASAIKDALTAGVDAFMLSPHNGWVPMWQSKVYPDHWQWWSERTGRSIDDNMYGRYYTAGGDVIKTLVEVCKRHNVAPFISMRINDVHGMEHVNRMTPTSYLVSRFYYEHPEYRLNPDHDVVAPAGYSRDYSRGLNWAIPAVREHRFAFLKEIVENYDLAGLELDFCRDNHLFRTDETSRQYRVQIITEFIERVRKLLDGTTGHGRKKWLSVRIPGDIKLHQETGIDVARMAQAGVDIFNVAEWFYVATQNDLPMIRRLAPDSAIYSELTHTVGRLFYEPGVDSNIGGANVYMPKTFENQFYTATYLALNSGADGVSFFNFQYYRQDRRNPSEPPFHIIRKLKDPHWVSQQDQYYFLGDWYSCSQLRSVGNLSKDHFVGLSLSVALPPKPKELSENARLRIHTKAPVDENIEITAFFNDNVIRSTNDLSAFYNNPYDQGYSDNTRRKAWIVPLRLIENGCNKIEFHTDSEKTVEIVFVDMAVH